MGTSIITRIVGPTYALSVAETAHAAVGIPAPVTDPCNYAEFTNPGSTDVCVVLAPYAATPAVPVVVFPVDGTPTLPNSFILPHGMTQPRIVQVPGDGGGFCVGAIGSAAGPSIIYITPVGNQS